MPTKVFYQVHRESLLQKERDFYENNKEMIKEQARSKYHCLSPEEKNKRSEYAKNWYNKLPEDKKNVKREYAQSKYHNMLMKKCKNIKNIKKNIKKYIVKRKNKSYK